VGDFLPNEPNGGNIPKSNNKNWTQEYLIYKQNTFFFFAGKITKKSYKMIRSFFQFFDCKIIANKRGFIEPFNKNLMW
jgi:hypothetical protein